jgi:hypothetical protein
LEYRLLDLRVFEEAIPWGQEEWLGVFMMMGGMFDASTGDGVEVCLNRVGTTFFRKCVCLWVEWCVACSPLTWIHQKGKGDACDYHLMRKGCRIKKVVGMIRLTGVCLILSVWQESIDRCQQSVLCHENRCASVFMTYWWRERWLLCAYVTASTGGLMNQWSSSNGSPHADNNQTIERSTPFLQGTPLDGPPACGDGEHVLITNMQEHSNCTITDTCRKHIWALDMAHPKDIEKITKVRITMHCILVLSHNGGSNDNLRSKLLFMRISTLEERITYMQ